jgi:hypothetical protein
VLGVHYGIYKSSYSISNTSYWIHPLYHSPPPITRIVSTGLIFYLQHVHTVFVPYSPSFTLSPHPPPSHWYQLPSPPGLRFCKNKNWHLCLFKIATQEVSLWHFLIYIGNIYIYIITWIGSFLLLFSFQIESPSYSDFNRFKDSIFILV